MWLNSSVQFYVLGERVIVMGGTVTKTPLRVISIFITL